MSKTVRIITPDNPTVEMFKNIGWEVVTLYDTATPDLICFTGGADVSPYLYGEENISSHCDLVRDEYEKQVFEEYVGQVPMVGICRGGQFLNVMNGGTMIQHISGHGMGIREITVVHHNGTYLEQTTQYIHEDHHQAMLIEGDGKGDLEGKSQAELLGWAHDGFNEIVWYPDTRCLCFQPHPEWGHEPTKELFFQLIKEYI